MVPEQRAPHTLLDSPLDLSAEAPPLQRQLHQRLKGAIMAGQIPPGGKLPSTRTLAETLAVSRNTVTAAYEHLQSEGYVLSDRTGTRVVAMVRKPKALAAQRPVAPTAAADRLNRIASMAEPNPRGVALRPGEPALSRFPLAAWQRVWDKTVRAQGTAVLGYGDPLGEMRLREAIARHVAVSRGVQCEPAQIVLTSGAIDALNLCVRLLCNPGDHAWVEDPGYRGAKAAMWAGDLRVRPMPVDAHGMHATEHDWKHAPPKLIYTTPSHQYPTGAVMSVARRMALMQAAQRHGAWIVEDDYDSEFRHTGEPIAAMQGLQPGAPVLYVGSFSKTMFPALRIGFVVLPQEVLARNEGALVQLLRGGNRHAQLALAEFMDSGQFSRHLGRMRRLYRVRQAALREALARYLVVPHTVDGGMGGLHLTVRLEPQYPDRAIAMAARDYGLAPSPLSSFSLDPQTQHNGLVLGYGNTSEETYASAARRIARLALKRRQSGA